MSKHVLVTGGAGFIGSHTADALLKKGYNVRILDALAKPVHLLGKPSYLSKDVEFLRGDVRNKSVWEKALAGIDIVYHFAAYQDYLPNFSKYFDVNAKGTALLYEVIVEKKLPIQKVIIASSQAIYGEGKYRCKKGHAIMPSSRTMDDLKRKKWNFICSYDSLLLTPQWAKEDAVLKPHNQYGISKYSEEKIALNIGKKYGIPTIAMRYSIVQGPRQSPFNLYSGALRIFVIHMLANKSPVIFEDGNQIRDFVNIYDVVGANILVMESKKTDYQIFNVGGGRKLTVLEFYRVVKKVLNSSIIPSIPGTFRVGDTRHIFSNIQKIKSIGFEPRHTIEDSIGDYAQWVQTLPYFERMLSASSKTLIRKGVVR